MLLRRVVLFDSQVRADGRPFIKSGQGQVYFGKHKQTNQEVVIKQIEIKDQCFSLIKELQVF